MKRSKKNPELPQPLSRKIAARGFPLGESAKSRQGEDGHRGRNYSGALRANDEHVHCVAIFRIIPSWRCRGILCQHEHRVFFSVRYPLIVLEMLTFSSLLRIPKRWSMLRDMQWICICHFTGPRIFPCLILAHASALLVLKLLSRCCCISEPLQRILPRVPERYISICKVRFAYTR